VPRHETLGRPKQLYVDIATPAVRTHDLIEFTDLDLDVEQLDDGEVTVLDRDEFAAHQVMYGYPPDLVERAESTCLEVAAAITARVDPFDGVSLTWLTRARPFGQP